MIISHTLQLTYNILKLKKSFPQKKQSISHNMTTVCRRWHRNTCTIRECCFLHNYPCHQSAHVDMHTFYATYVTLSSPSKDS